EKGRFKEAAWDEIRRIIRDEDPPRPSTRLTSTGTLPSLAACRQTEPTKLTQQLKGELDWIVMKALEKERTRRYETASGLARDIERYLKGEAVEACPPTLDYRLRKTYRKHRASILTGVAFVSLLSLGLLLTTFLAIKNQQLARVAQELARDAQRNAALAEENAAKEVAQRKIAEQQTAASKAVSDFLFDDVLSAFDPAKQPDVDITLREVIDNASQRLKGASSEAPQVEAAIKASLGQAYLKLGHYEIAHSMFRDAYKLRATEFGEEHTETLDAQEAYVRTFRQKRWQEAIPFAQSLFEKRKATQGDMEPATLRARRLLLEFKGLELANSEPDALTSQRWAELEQELKSIMEKQREIHGGSHDDIFDTTRVLCFVVYAPQGRYEERLESYRQMLALSRELHGDVHPVTIGLMTGLCAAFYDVQQYDELETQARKALLLRKELGYGNTATLESFLLLSYLERGRADEGIAAYEEFAKLRQDDGAQFKLAHIYAKLKDRATHEEYCAELLARHENTYTPLGDYNAASAYLIIPPENQELKVKAIEMARRSPPISEATPGYFRYALNRGIAEYRAGEFRKAVEWLSYPKIRGDDVSYHVSRVYLAMTKFQLGNHEEAQLLLEECKESIGQLEYSHFAWANVIRAQLGLEEAIAMIEGSGSPEDSPAR
ncbi:MAG: tetratricopeptide repeat protein, partial [bacterium]|nr:tetratricopeptide repeat protein [bacterium]